jgi:hypothetical protein
VPDPGAMMEQIKLFLATGKRGLNSTSGEVFDWLAEL